MPGVDTMRFTEVPLDITGAGMLVVVSPRSRWQNDVYTGTQVQGTAWRHVGYAIPHKRFVPTWSEVSHDGDDKHVSLFMNHEVSDTASFVWVCCSVSEEIGQSVGSKKREYQSFDSLRFIICFCHMLQMGVTMI